ncbi:hypothetical protein HNY73_011850 [Argiope bruennichi]|uniref:Uncharacterized protein n=1 Tax=Argiope bruennichi TaxID=94029 RepID=A0A8T0EXJ8_ARGBR|nr:hypothetical protein HNY73_011850 [Argiope bruennichi]
MEPVDVPELGRESTEEFCRFIRNWDKEVINGIYIKGAKYERLQPVIVDLVQRIRRVYITLSNETMGREELATFNNKIDPNFSSQITSFLNHRIALSENLVSCANGQDIISTMTTIARLLGFTVEAINSLHVAGNLLVPFLAISPFPKFSIRKFGVIGFYLGTGCLITSFYGYSWLKHMNFCAINSVEEDKELSERVDNLLSEKDIVVEELFSVDEEVITGIEKILYLTATEKIFAALLISVMQKKESLCIKDKKFLCQAYMFSRTETAKIWYRRALYRIRHVDQPMNIRIPKDDLLHLKMMSPTACQSEEILIFLLKSLKMPGFVVFGADIPWKTNAESSTSRDNFK